MWTGLIKTSNVAGRLVLSLAMLIIPVLGLAPCCCVKAALAAETHGASTGPSCCRKNDEPAGRGSEQSRGCFGQSSPSSPDSPGKSCCDLSEASCECCQPETKAARSIAPRVYSKPHLQGPEMLLADFHVSVELSEKLDASEVLSALKPCPKNRTQSLLCVWRN